MIWIILWSIMIITLIILYFLSKISWETWASVRTECMTDWTMYLTKEQILKYIK
jgi:hypothetical protein